MSGASQMKSIGLLIFHICFAAIFSFSGNAQRLNKVAEFSAYDNEVQVLPGIFVIVRNDIKDSKTNRYAFKSGHFIKLNSRLPSSVESWVSFNWANVDFRNQISRSDFETVALSGLIPPGSKVKGFGKLDNVKPGKTLLFICYASRPQGSNAESEEQHDLHVMMIMREPLGGNPSYKKMDDLLVAQESSFGAIVVQPQSDGALIFLYSTSTGGTSHLINSVDVLAVAKASSFGSGKAASMK